MTLFRRIPYWSYIVAVDDEDIPYKLRDRIRNVAEVVFPSREAAFRSALIDTQTELDLELDPTVVFQWPEFEWTTDTVLGLQGWAKEGVHPAVAIRIFQLDVRED